MGAAQAGQVKSIQGESLDRITITITIIIIILHHHSSSSFVIHHQYDPL
jgi:hypothetical protein